MRGGLWYDKTAKYISNLEKAEHTLILNSGISTLALVLALVPTGSTVVVQDDFYSGTRHLVSKIFNQRVN